MQPMIKKILPAILLLGLGLQAVWAFSPEGPSINGDSWQTPALGYGIGFYAPKNLGEEYRRNTPVMYYACDASYWEYFRSNGVAAVDSTFAVLNALTNVDNYSDALTEFPLESRHQNYRAQALGIIDIKTTLLGLMMGQLGLTDPVRFTWTLHGRAHIGPAPCPLDTEYLVVQRNFDFTSASASQLAYSPYVNNVLYSYQIYEGCVTIPVALAVPFSADPLASTYAPVASFIDGGAMSWGDYYTGLTRDDMAGLRYLMSTNNVNWETAANGSDLFTVATNTTPGSLGLFPPNFAFTSLTNSTNFAGYYYYTYAGGTNSALTNAAFGYGDLASFVAYVKTNPPASVQAAYPGVVFSSYSNYFVPATNISYFFYYTNGGIGSPYGSSPTLAIGTNYTHYRLAKYDYQFANIFTNHFYTNRVKMYTTTVAPTIGSPYGSPVTNTTTYVYTNQIGGDFFVLPIFSGGSFGLAGSTSGSMTNVCPLDIVQTDSSDLLAVTNFLTGGGTNSLVLTNTASTTNTSTFSQSVYIVNYFTNYQFEVYQTTCSQIAGATTLYQGIKNIKFVRADYDSLVGQYWQPVTNYYTMVTKTNGLLSTQYFQRIATQPDFLFQAADLTGSGTASGLYSVSIAYDNSNVGTNLAGPGTIVTPTTFVLSKTGPAYFNSFFDSSSDTMDGTPYFTQTPGGDMTNLFYASYFVWGTFDGTTNAPIVYPNTLSLNDWEGQVLARVSPANVPDGSAGISYADVTFTVASGYFTGPFTWSATSLPDGMSLSSDGVLSGTPTLSGTYEFTLMLTDYIGRTAKWNYTITIQ
jgi:hypothetical protein